MSMTAAVAAPEAAAASGGNANIASATINSHNQTHNLSHYLHNKQEIYQSRQRKHRSSQNHHDRRRLNNNLGFSADKLTDEARYNLATRIMSNGVEVIVAGDKTTLPGGHPNTHLRILTTTTEAFKMPLTLAPSTLKDAMLLMLPQSTSTASDPAKSPQVLNELQSFYNQNQFVTKTCLTTYTYSTTYVVDGTTKIESLEKVITNTATEERNAYNIRPTATSGITLTQTPHLGTGVFKTTYTYLNTVLDGDQPVVITSQHTVTNTITAPDDYLSILQPSEPQTTLFETNTYYNTMVLTKTLTDNDISKVISTTDIVKQVVVTELLPSKSTSVMTSYIAIDAEGNESPADKDDILGSPLLSATDIVKTMFVTYTYFNTYLINGSTIERTNVSTTSAIATEKLYIFPTTKRMPSPQTTTRNALPIRIEPLENSIGPDDHDYSNELMNDELRQTVNIYATKTLATTFTFITTLLQGPSTDGSNGATSVHDDYGGEPLSTVITSNTRVVENIVTESIPMKFLPSTAVHRLKLLFFGDENVHPQMKNENKFTTLATLIGGQAIEITAVRDTIDPTTKIKDTESQSTLSYESGQTSSSGESGIEVDNTKNELENDQEAAGSIDSEAIETHPSHSVSNSVELNPLKNTTKIIKTQTQSPVTNFIDSINLNGLRVIQPMIEAVAGLIKPMMNWNNDTIPSNTQVISVHHTSPYPMYTPQFNGNPSGNLPPIPDYIENYATNTNQTLETIPQPPSTIEPAKGHARNPIYIPVNGNGNKESYDIENLTPVNFLPPEIIDHSESSNEIGQTNLNVNPNANANPSTKNKVPIIDGGIPISPGDVITANSDVIFGRPTGNRPRIPLNRDTPVSINNLATGNQAPDSVDNPSIHSETYIGPPPPPPSLSQKPHPGHIQHPQHIQQNQQQHIQQNPQHAHHQQHPVHPSHAGLQPLQLPQQPLQSFAQLQPLQPPQPPHLAKANPNFNKIQIFRNKPMFVPNKPPPHLMPALPPHQLIKNQVHMNRIRNAQNHLIKEPNRLVGQPIRPNVIPLNHVIPTPNTPPQNIPNGNGPTPNIGVPQNDMHKYVLNNLAGGMNDIIEIQRIPEVFSTDLPPVHIYHAPQEIVSFTAETIEPSTSSSSYRPPQDIQTINQFPEVVESATGQPLFVNIQPSQIAKVVIPHGSSSALIFGGVQEMHKSGEYFDDPSPYPNINDQVISIHSKPSIEVTKNVNAEVQDVNLGSVQVGSVPVVSNQKVNVDSHVLSQDVDMHAPPIIFRNQDSNDIPITSGTYTGGEYHTAHALNHNRTYDRPPYQQPLPTGNLIRDNNRSPFVVDIQSINLGMSNEDGDANVSNEGGEDNGPQLHHDHVFDQHKEDDYENEQGEVIQESNAVPQLVSSDQSISDNLNQISDYTKPTTKHSHKDPKIPFTQTEANSLWEKYPSTTEPYPITFTTERSTGHPTVYQPTTSADRHPFGGHQPKLQIPSIAPALVNDMYVPSTVNHSQTVKPIPPTRIPNFVSRNPNNKQVFYGHHSDLRPSKFANIGTPHHLTLQNLPVPPHYAGPLFGDSHRPLPPPQLPPHLSRRPISIQQKPFSRYPIHYNKPIPTNYSLHQGEPIKPNWHSSKPFDASHFGLNIQTGATTTTTTTTTVRSPTSTLSDQQPQTSELTNTISTHRPFAMPNRRPEPELPMITHYTDPSTNITQAAQDSEISFDLSRGKPFIYARPPESTSNLNIGEENRPMHAIKSNQTTDTQLNADVFDYNENKDTHNFGAITEATLPQTTDNLPGITNAAFIPFGEKVKVSQPIVTSAEQPYPKTPATEMQPPPTYTTKYKPYIQKHVPAIAPQSSPHQTPHMNVLIEEVMGLHPPPIPKLSVKQKHPSEIHGNYGKVSVAHSLHPMHGQSNHQGIYSITAPTHYPDAPTFVATQHHHQQQQQQQQQHHLHQQQHHHSDDSDSSTEVIDAVQPQIVTQTPEPDVAESDHDTNEDFEIPYQHIGHDQPRKQTTKLPEITTLVSDLDDYVRYSIDSNPELPSFTTRKPTKLPSRIPSNGHMPQSPHFDENSLIEPSQKRNHIFTEDFTELHEDIEPSTEILSPSTSEYDSSKLNQPTVPLPAETVKATRHTIHDTTVLTVTTTKTTVRSHGITSTVLLTLTRTKTSTIVDTVTHTLVKPTRVTHEPTIKPTIFTAPVTMKKVSGSSASVVPNPSFSIYAIGSAHDESEHEHDSSNDSSEDQSFEFDSIPDIQHMISPTPKIPEPTPPKHTTKTANSSNDSIFVVMTDRKKLGTINLNADLLHTLTAGFSNGSIKSSSNDDTQKKPSITHLGALDDVSTEDEDLFDNLPKRDEDDNNNDVSHVLLGGILIATPPKSEVSKSNGHAKPAKNPHPPVYDNNPADEIDEHIESQGAAIIEETRTVHEKSKVAPLECQPDCKAVDNEVCQITGDLARCMCRPGFARMFLDRPCKPTYTYTLHLAVSQLHSQSLKYEDALRNPSSPKYSHLMQVVHDAIDRMVMQSELRDIYHGVHVAGFNNITKANGTQAIAKASLGPISAGQQSPPVKGVETEFHLQLSDNTKNEEQIMDVFKKYLQKNNFNLGGTNLYSSQSLIEHLRANDFDECMNAKYHDCSENAYCFNLRGTYTCSCREGFVDLSENPTYPGRVCSAEMMGCERCNYHGSCIEHIDEDNEVREVLCDCFQWYAGERCYINLKVVLVGLIALGGILFALLLICIILTCWKHNRPNGRRRTVVPGIDILPHKTLTVHSGSKAGTLQDRRAMIEDTSSEASEDSLQLPYVAKKQQQQNAPSSKNMKKVINKPTSAPPKGMAPAPPKANNNNGPAAAAAAAAAAANADQNRSLTVMIPRAKYYSQQTPNITPEAHASSHSHPHQHQHQHQQHQDRRGVQTGVATATQGQATMFTTTDSMGSTAEAKLLSYLDASPSTSKNFVKKKTSGHNSKNHAHDDNHHYPYHSGETGALVSAGFEVSATVVHDSLTTVPNANGLDASSSVSTNKKTTDHLVDWLTNVPENELIISEARSYGETLVHPQTKTLVPSSQHYRSQNTSLYDKPLSTILMDEADTMAERDLGSTFLLPHTHLYKPDRASDISGFDSL